MVYSISKFRRIFFIIFVTFLSFCLKFCGKKSHKAAPPGGASAKQLSDWDGTSDYAHNPFSIKDLQP